MSKILTVFYTNGSSYTFRNVYNYHVESSTEVVDLNHDHLIVNQIKRSKKPCGVEEVVSTSNKIPVVDVAGFRVKQKNGLFAEVTTVNIKNRLQVFEPMARD